MKILVSLVSEQTIPNVLFIKERTDCSRYIFISTNEMERKNKTNNIIQATKIDESRVIVKKVDENTPKDITDVLGNIEYNDGDTFIVNLTGGTKIMSITAYTFFSSLESQMYYLPIGRNVVHKVFPLVHNIESILNYSASLSEYLTSYGISIPVKNWKKKNRLHESEDFTYKLFDSYIRSFVDAPCEILRKRRNDKSYQFIDEEESSVSEFLQSIDYSVKIPAQLTSEQILYLTGGWFEEYIYLRVKKYLDLDEDEIALNLNLKPGNADNEFDVMFIYRNMLYIFECKTGLSDGQRNLFNDTAYKLAAVRREFGLSAKTYLCTLHSLRNENGELVDKYKRRSMALNVEIIDRSILISVNEMDSVLSRIKV